MTTDTEKLRELLAGALSEAGCAANWDNALEGADAVLPYIVAARETTKAYWYRQGKDDQAQVAADELDRLRAELAEARKEKALIVAWLRAEAQLCDCHAHDDGECACGAWGTEPGERSYKRVYVEDIADAIERGEHRIKSDD